MARDASNEELIVGPDGIPRTKDGEMYIVISKGGEPPPPGPNDVPYTIPGEGQTDYVIPGPSSDAGDKANAEHLTTYEAVTAASRGEDPVAAHSAVSGMTAEQLTARARQQYDETVTKGLEQLLAQSAATQGPDEFAQEVEGVGAYASQVGANVSSATVPERKMVEEISRLYGDATDETEKKIINQLYFKRRMSEILFSQGYGDWAKNVVGLFIMSDESLEAGMTATGAKSYSTDAVTSWFSSADNWRKFVSAFAGLSAEEQVQDFKAIASVMRDTRDENAIKIMDHLSQLVDPSSVDSTAFWHGADKFFLAGTVANFARTASRTLRGANLAAVAKKLDNIDLAAKTANVAAKDAKAAEVAGTTRLDAATSHVPFDNTKLLEGADPELADEIAKQQQILNKYLELSKDLERGFLTPEEAQKAADNFVEELRNTPGITDVALVSVDGKSVTVTYRQVPSKAKRARDARGRFVRTGDTADTSATEERLPSVLQDIATRIAQQGYEKVPVSKVPAARNMSTLLSKLDAGKITPEEFENEIRLLADRLAEASATKAANRIMSGRARGADIVREKLLAARRRGDIDHDTAEFALWVLDKNPNMAEGLGITVRKAPAEQAGAAGDYNPVASIIRLFKGTSNVGTAVHEILHHTERMMPAFIQKGIRQEWVKSYTKAMRTASPAQREAIGQMIPAMAGHEPARKAVMDAFSSGVLDPGKHYQLVNPSEYWAVSATRILSGRFEAGSWAAQAKQWLKEMSQKIQGTLGLRSDAPVLKGLKEVLSGDGSQLSSQMLFGGRLESPPTGVAAGDAAPKLTATRHFTVDDVTGEFVAEDIGIVKATTKGIQSPNSLFQSNRTRLVNEPEAILREQEALAVKFKQAMVAAFKGMSKASAQKINAVIARGRDEERVYSYAELVGGDVLTKEEFNVYANMRHLFDIAYAAENTMVRNKALAKGLREVRVGPNKEIARPAENVSGAKAMLRASEDQMIHIPTPVDNGPIYRKASDDLIQKYYDEGYVLVRKDGGQYFAVGDNRFADFALVPRADVKDLPPTFLHFRKGYAPVEYKNGVYFAKTVTRGQVGEASRAVGTVTHRYFDNITDATTFANEIKVNGITDAAGNVTKFDQADVKVLHNREMSTGELEEERIRIFGGLYNSARKGERLKFGLDAADPELVDPVISLTRYFDNLSRNYPMHLWRIGMEQTWMNTARARWGLGRDYRGTFQDAVKHISDSLSTSERAEAEKSHMQLALQMKIPTTEERAIRTWTRDLAERIEAGGNSGLRKGAARALHRFDSRDPVNAILSSGFNLVLGMWNFSTMVVQGFGAIIPMGIDPIRAPKHLAQTLALGSLDLILDPTALDLSKARIGTALSQKIGGGAGEGLGDLHKSWTMSGLRESVISNNPEYEALSKGLPYDRTLLKKILSTHTIFYKMGELGNYRYSWSAAFDWWKRQPGNARRAIDTKAVDEIRARADTYLLHMNRANRATNQTGAWRIPSQFTNVFFKYAEALTGKELTRKEKITMLMSQSLLFGYAGAPMLSGVGDWAIEKMGVELDEEQKDAVRSGFIQHAVHEYLGLNVDIAGRASIMKGLYDEIHNLLLGGESLGEVAAGAAGGIQGKRAAEALSALYNLGRAATSASEDIAPDIWQAAIDATLDMVSSWRSLSAAREISTSRLFKDRRGDILMRLEEGEINTQTKIAMALGFSHSDLNKIYLSSMNKLDDSKRMQEKGSAIIKTIDRILSVNDSPQNDPKRREIINLVMGAMMENETPASQKKIRGYVLNKVLSPTTQEDRLRKSQLEELYEEGILFGGPTAPSYLEQ